MGKDRTLEIIKTEIERLKSIEYPCDNSQQATGFFNALDRMTDFLSTLESEKPINPDAAMKELDEKIALVKQRGTWDGIDVDKYMDEVRGREPEKPMELEEEINRYLEPIHTADIQFEPFTQMTKCARHFAEWGYLRAAEKYNEIEYNRQRAEEPVSDDLEEAAKEYVSNIAYCGDDIELEKEQSKRDFIAGAKWMKEQDEKEQADLFTIVALDAAQRAREQMMKDGIEGEICHLGVDFLDYNISELDEYIKRFKVGDKVRIIIVKE